MRALKAIAAQVFAWSPFLFITTAQAQSYQPPQGEFHRMRVQEERRLDSLHATLPDSIFYHEGGEYGEFQRWLEFWELRAPHGDMNAYDEVMKNFAASHAHDGGSFRSNEDPWLELGPRRRRNNMSGIGPIRSIQINKTDHSSMLCNSYSGGLFYTTDGATTWQNAGTDSGWPHSGCWDEKYYPGTTTSIYALCSIGTDRSTKISYIGGVYRTANGGATWDRIADHSDLGDPDPDPDINMAMQKLLFDEKVNDLGDHRLFTATSIGLFKCDDPSATDPTWVPITISLPSEIATAYPGVTASSDILVNDIEYLPGLDPTSTLCASMRFVSEDGTTFSVSRFMISTDNGDTWSSIPAQPAVNPSITDYAVATTIANPNSFFCYLGASGSGNCTIEEYDVLNGWASSPIADNISDSPYSSHVAFAIDPFGSGVAVVAYSTGARKKVPGTPGLSSLQIGHADIEDLIFDPDVPDKLWMADHGGVSSVDISTGIWTDHSDGLGVGDVESLSSSQNIPDYVGVALFHDHSALTRTPYGPGWDPDWADVYPNGGDGVAILIDPKEPDYLYQSWQQGHWKRKDDAESSNAAGTSIPLPSGSGSDQQWWSMGALNRAEPSHFYRVGRMDYGPTTGVGGNTVENYELEVYRSSDRGTTNTGISNLADNLEACRHADQFYNWNDAEQFWWVRSSPADPDHLYVALQNYNWQQRIFRTTMIDAPDPQTVRNSWQEVPHPRRAPLGSDDSDREPAPAAIAFDPEDANTIYIAYPSSKFESVLDYASPIGAGMVYRLDVSDLDAYPVTGKFDCDGAYPCNDITMNLPNTFMGRNCLTYEQGSDGGLYLSTDVGVYFTDNKRIAAYDPMSPQDADDMGNTNGWVRLGDLLPHVNSAGLEINYQVNRIRDGLNGRGAWEHGLHCPAVEEFNETGTYSTDEFLEARADIMSEAVVPDGLKVIYRAGNEIHLTPGFHAAEGSVFHAFIHPCDVGGNSFHPKEMEVGDQADGPEAPVSHVLPDILAYPVPAHDRLNVICPWVGQEGIGQLTLTNSLGQVVQQAIMHGSTTTLDVSAFHGLYLLVICTGEECHTARVMVD
jgi:hypothetical protein